MSWIERLHVQQNGTNPVALTTWDALVTATGNYGASVGRCVTACDIFGLIVAFPFSFPKAPTPTGNSAVASNTAFSIASINATFPTPNIAGHQLLCDVTFQSNPIGQVVVAVADSAGNTWQPVNEIRRIGISESYVQTWICLNCVASGSNTVTLTSIVGSAFAGPAMAISEYTGLGVPATLPLWQPNTVYGLGAGIIDSLGHRQIVHAVTSGLSGMSGPTQPPWNDTPAGTTSDNQLTWIESGITSDLASAESVFGNSGPMNISMVCGNVFLHLVAGLDAACSAVTPSAPAGAILPPPQASNPFQRGNIDFDQIRAIARSGDGSEFLMFGGGAETPGNVIVFDSQGNGIDGGISPSTLRKFAAAFTAVAGTPLVISHNLGTTDIASVQVFDSSSPQNSSSAPEFQTTTINEITITFGISFSGRIVIIG